MKMWKVKNLRLLLVFAIVFIMLFGITITSFATFGASIKLTKTVSNLNPLPGEEVTYTFTVENTGSRDLSYVQITDPDLSATIRIGKLAKGRSATETQTYTIPEDAEAGKEITNTATVTGSYREGFQWRTVSDTDSVTVAVAASPGIAIEKSVEPEEQYAGEDVKYTFTVTNTGNIALTDVVITDKFLGDEEVWAENIGDLAAGCTSTINRTYTIPEDAEAGAAITNEATVTGYYDEGEEYYVEDSASATVTVKEPEVVPEPPITLTKTVSPDRQYAGGTVKYTFTVTNTGSVPLRDVTITDDKIEGWIENVGVLDVGDTYTITKDHTIPAGTPVGPYTNTATVKALYCEECFPEFLEQSSCDSGCNGDNGENGSNGNNGENGDGDNGENGSNGNNGENGNGDNGCCQEIEATASATVTVIARYSPGPSVTYYTLEIKIEGEGTTTPGAGTRTYPSGSSVQIVPTPADGWIFAGWKGDTPDADGKIAMNGNKTLTAIFEKIEDKEDKEDEEKEDQEEFEDEEIPAEAPEEPVIEEKPEVEQEEVPTDTKKLPKTGGIPSGLFYGLGALAAGSGVFIGLKRRRK
jgi:LPXTG-motif cell wall-anchored protein